jgi:hypothetical protein
MMKTSAISTLSRRISDRVILNLINNAFYAASLPPPVGGGSKALTTNMNLLFG